MKPSLFLCLTVLASGLSPAAADPPEVIDVRLRPSGDTWRAEVTLLHPDTGWDHYADGWRIESEDGSVLGFRELLHPHVTEQPFTRSLSGIALPDGTTTVYVRARCNVDGWSPTRVKVGVKLQ